MAGRASSDFSKKCLKASPARNSLAPIHHRKNSNTGPQVLLLSTLVGEESQRAGSRASGSRGLRRFYKGLLEFWRNRSLQSAAVGSAPLRQKPQRAFDLRSLKTQEDWTAPARSSLNPRDSSRRRMIRSPTFEIRGGIARPESPSIKKVSWLSTGMYESYRRPTLHFGVDSWRGRSDEWWCLETP